MQKFQLKEVRLSFNALFEPQDFNGNQDFAFNAKLLIEKGSPQHKQIEQALLEVAEEVFPGKGKQVIDKIKDDPAQYCLQPYDDQYVSLATKRKAKAGRPVVVDQNRNPLAEGDGKPYSGCYVNVLVRPWAMGGKGNKYWVRCGLEGVQFAKDGQAFGQRTTADDFDDLGESDDGKDIF